LKFPELDEDIYNAFIICRENYLPTSDSKLVEIAKTVRNEHTEDLKEQRGKTANIETKKMIENNIKELKGMAFSDGWIRRFKKRRHIRKERLPQE